MDIFHDLALNNAVVAAEHEEFVASINRRELKQVTVNILEKLLLKIEHQIKANSEKIGLLQSAYHQQEELLGNKIQEILKRIYHFI